MISREALVYGVTFLAFTCICLKSVAFSALRPLLMNNLAREQLRESKRVGEENHGDFCGASCGENFGEARYVHFA